MMKVSGHWQVLYILCVNSTSPEGGSLSRERRVISASLHLLLYPFQYQHCRGETETACQGLRDFKAVCTGLCVCVYAYVGQCMCTQRYTHTKPLCLMPISETGQLYDKFLGPAPRKPYTSTLGLCLTGWGFLPEGPSLTSKDPPLRPQKLADLSRGPAGVDTFLHPVGQVKQRHVGGQREGGLQWHHHNTGLPIGKVCMF